MGPANPPTENSHSPLLYEAVCGVWLPHLIPNGSHKQAVTCGEQWGPCPGLWWENPSVTPQPGFGSAPEVDLAHLMLLHSGKRRSSA